VKYSVLFLVAVLGSLVTCAGVAMNETARNGLDSTYVNETNDEACLELARNGDFFMRSALGQHTSGTWQKKEKTVDLKFADGRQLVMGGADDTLVDESGARWSLPSRGTDGKDCARRPVLVTVRDTDTGRPLREFSYDYWIETPSGREVTRWARRRDVKSENGTVVIDAPFSCDLTVCVDSPDYLNEFGNWGIFTIESEDDSRSVELLLRKGTTLRGTVTAAVGGEPVSGARVSAVISASPDAHGLDLERSVVTDEHGKFVLKGMDPELGISVSQASYLAFDGSDIANHAKRLSAFDMSASIALRKSAQTVGTTADAVALKHVSLTEVRGAVVGPDDKPVEHFEVILGPADDPRVWQCHKAIIADSNGCFRLDAPFQGRNWIVILAAGMVPWEGSINAGNDAGAGTIRLSKGSALQGRIVARGSKNQMQGAVVLTPRQWVKNVKESGASAGEEFLSQEAAVGTDGKFLISHVISGEYVLAFTGPMASPTEFSLSIGSADVDLGTIEVAGLGGIKGKAVWPPGENAGEAIAYADGEVRAASDPVGDVIRFFTTDENGDFDIEGVPSGVVAVNILPKGSGNAGDFLHFARVCDAKKTVVDFNNTKQSAKLCLNIMVGNGSEADYRSALGCSTTLSTNSVSGALENHDVPAVIVRLVPSCDVPSRIPGVVERTMPGEWFWIDLDDIPPGKHRLELEALRGAGLESIIHAEEVELAAGDNVDMSGPLWVTLGSGSITGRLPPLREDGAATVVAVVEKKGLMPPQYAVCDADGRFCVSFLRPGLYSLLAHNPQEGWARADGLAVSNNVCDAGVFSLAAGATVCGELQTSFEKRADSYEIIATESSGVRMSIGSRVDGRNGERFSFANLWPGDWSIELLGDGEELRVARIPVTGNGTITTVLRSK